MTTLPAGGPAPDDAGPRPRFRAKVYAYHHHGWQWAYEVLDTRPPSYVYAAGYPVCGRAQFTSQPDALLAACATLERMGLNG